MRGKSILGAFVFALALTFMGLNVNAANLSNPVDNAGNFIGYSHVSFGNYPQTEVTDKSITAKIDAAINDPYNTKTCADVSIDGVKYRRIHRDIVVSEQNWPKDNKILFRYFKWEPVIWRVLNVDTTSGTAMVMADKAIDCYRYQVANSNEEAKVTWSECDLRKFLNDTFYNSVFSEGEKNAITTTTVKCNDEKMPDTTLNLGADTQDKLFVLSYKQITDSKYGFNADLDYKDPNRVMNATDYCFAKGSSSEKNAVWQWTRSPRNNAGNLSYIMQVYPQGNLSKETYTYDRGISVVPVMNIKLGSITSNMVCNSIKYVTDGGLNSYTNPSTYNTSKGVASLAPATKEKCDFAGWYSDKSFSKKVTSIPAGTSGDVTLYAKWVPGTYKINYVMGGGINSPDNPATYTYGVGVTSLKDPSRPGYKFYGWFKNENCQGYAVTNIDKETYGEITLYPGWVPRTYQLNFYYDYGFSQKFDTLQYTYDVGVPTLKVPSAHEGWIFAGWYTDKTRMTKITSIPANYIPPTNPTYLYAKWVKPSYSISYELDGGINPPENPTKYNYGVGVSKLLAPKKSGYIFEGWYTDSEYKQKIETITTEDFSDFTLYAKWIKVKYSNTITVKDFVKERKSSAQKVKLGAKAEGNAILSYKSDNKKVKVDTWGTVTIPKNFNGVVKITITAAETEEYKKATAVSTITVTTKKPAISKVTASKKAFKLSWKKVSGAEGYEICYSTDKKFTKPKKASAKKTATAATVKKLKGKKTYYVKMRSYMKVNGKKIYSDWSAAKKVKTK